METNTQTSKKRRGNVKWLPDTEPLSTHIPKTHRLVLDAYARQNTVSLAAAVRRAIELLEADMQRE